MSTRDLANGHKDPRPLVIGIIGDYDPALLYHRATIEAINHAANVLSVAVDCVWLPTESLDGQDGEGMLGRFDALWCAPGSPYRSMDGALKSIRFARERDVPFLGT